MDPVLGAAVKRRGKAASVRGVSRTLSALPWKSSCRMDGLLVIGLPVFKHVLISLFLLLGFVSFGCVVRCSCVFKQLYVSIDT